MKMKFKSLFFFVLFTFAFMSMVECRSFAQKNSHAPTEEKKVVISVEELGKKFEVSEEEAVLPNGEKRRKRYEIIPMNLNRH